MKKDAVEEAVRQLLIALGEDPNRSGIKDTPARVARFYEEWFAASEYRKFTAFETIGNDMVLVKGAPFYSLCEHHLLPFHGRASIAYIPDKKMLGLSKLVRILDKYSRRLQIQEQLTSQIADELMEVAGAKGCMVILEAEHLCMSMRGVESPGTKTLTSAIRGVFAHPPEGKNPRQEALDLIRCSGLV
jgi:GTP cyclohydrolase I